MFFNDWIILFEVVVGDIINELKIMIMGICEFRCGR